MALKLHTLLNAGCFLAQWLASLAKVLLAPMPTHTGKPVQCKMRPRMAWPYACKSREAKPLKSKKDSSMEYTSCAGLKSRKMPITRLLMSAYKA